MPDLPSMYVFCRRCRRHVLRDRWTAHAAQYHQERQTGG